MLISQILAVSENAVIGKDNKLAWHLPNDLKFFKSHTLGHPIIMGRKTFESVGKPLPGRTNIIITGNEKFSCEGCIIARTPEAAIHEAALIDPDEIFIIGGAAVFRETLPWVNRIYLTEVKSYIEGDTTFYFDKQNWKEIFREDHFKDDKHAYDYSFIILEPK